MQVVTWTLAGISLLLTAGRYRIRLRTIKTLRWDDGLHGLAAVVLIAYLAVYMIQIAPARAIASWISGLSPEPPPKSLEQLFRLKLTTTFLLYTNLYLIKGAFLVFYRELFGVRKSFVKVWWIVVIFTTITFILNILPLFWFCGSPQTLSHLGKHDGSLALSEIDPGY